MHAEYLRKWLPNFSVMHFTYARKQENCCYVVSCPLFIPKQAQSYYSYFQRFWLKNLAEACFLCKQYYRVSNGIRLPIIFIVFQLYDISILSGIIHWKRNYSQLKFNINGNPWLSGMMERIQYLSKISHLNEARNKTDGKAVF